MAQGQEGSEAVSLSTDSHVRKGTPVYSGLLAYFPLALAEVSRLSKAGNDKHNPGQPLHWSRGKSNDHADCAARHLIEHGTVDPDDGHRHSTKLAWRALAILQLELEAAALPQAANDAAQPGAVVEIPAELIPVYTHDWLAFHEHQRAEYLLQRVRGATVANAMREARIHRQAMRVGPRFVLSDDA